MKEKKKKRIVILLGAGAAVPWGGMTTIELTKHLIEKCEFKTQSGKNFLEFLQHVYIDTLNEKRKNNPLKYDDANFEILISIVEYLAEYFYNINQTPLINQRPEWIELFDLAEKIESEIPELKILNSNYSIEFRDFTFKNNEGVFNDSTQIGFERWLLFYKIHFSIIKSIRNHVLKYSENSKYSKKLAAFLEFLSQNKYLIRIYSTNYDDIISHLEMNVPIFNGFKFVENLTTSNLFGIRNSIYSYDINDILKETNRNTFYSLHCNVKFNYDDNKFSQLNLNDKIVYLKEGNFDLSSTSGTTEKSKILNPTIVSGQQKILRTSLEPYKTFCNSFHRDCFEADLILCIGFSFSDFHINQIFNEVAHSRKHDVKKKLKFISISTSNGIEVREDGFKRIQKIVQLLYTNNDRDFNMLFFKNKSEHWFESDNSIFNIHGDKCEINFKVFTNGFDGFLDDEKNWQEVIE